MNIFMCHQRVHDKHNMAESMLDHLDELSTRGAYWFIEGTPQYSAEVLGADNGGTKFRNTFKQIIDELYFLRQQKDEKYKQGLSISKHITLAGHESVRSTAQSGSNTYIIRYQVH